MTTNQERVVLSAVDYSETGLLAFRRALAMSDGGTLHVVNVVEIVPAPPTVVGTSSVPAPSSIDDENKVVRRYVEQHLTSARPSPKRVVSHVAIGNPAEEIVRLASDLEADLIVIGAHGRRGVHRLFLGSVAERVVRLATCPVLVERPKTVSPSDIPFIDPPCPECAKTRRETNGAELWCSHHREQHGRRHTHHSQEVAAVFPSGGGDLGSVT